MAHMKELGLSRLNSQSTKRKKSHCVNVSIRRRRLIATARTRSCEDNSHNLNMTRFPTLVGHAIQDKEGYAFLRFRNSIVPAVNIGSTMSMPLFFIGLIMGSAPLLNIGILLFCGVLVFHLVTLPVEFDASARALKLLSETGLLKGSEVGGAKAVLDAAALTYVAALVMTVLQLIRLLALRGMRRD